MSNDFSILSGLVSHLSTTATVSGSVKRGKGNVSTSHKTDFRIDGQAVVFNAAVNIADGDQVTLAGKVKKGEFRARAIRNEETGVVYSGMTTLAYILGVVCVVIGIPLSFIIIGIPLVLVGAWAIWEGYMNNSAIQSLP